MQLAKKGLAVLLSLAGVALAAVGIWFIAHVGTAGTATFTVSTDGTRPVLVPPEVSARLTVPATITVTAPATTEIWVGRAGATDIKAALGGSAVTTVSSVDVRGWALRTTTTGSAERRNLASYDIWRAQSTATGEASVTIPVDEHPPTVVFATPGGGPTEVSITWTRSRWFFQALAALVFGLLLAVVGVSLFVPRWNAPQPGRRQRGVPPVPQPVPAPVVGPTAAETSGPDGPSLATPAPVGAAADASEEAYSAEPPPAAPDAQDSQSAQDVHNDQNPQDTEDSGVTS